MGTWEFFAVYLGVPLLLTLALSKGKVRAFARRPHLRDDLKWYVLWGVTYRLIAPLVVIVAVLPIMLLAGVDVQHMENGYGPLAQLPLWAQCVLALVLGDFLNYWKHRFFHSTSVWPFHAVHHSSTHMDWLSATRFHPVNEVVSQLAYVAPVALLGFSPAVAAIVGPPALALGFLAHSGLDWTYGPLRYVFVSPVFHRHHHDLERPGCDSNFGGILTLWDLVFGTYYWPEQLRPARLGTSDPVPEGFRAQYRYPLEVLKGPGGSDGDGHGGHGNMGTKTGAPAVAGAPVSGSAVALQSARKREG